MTHIKEGFVKAIIKKSLLFCTVVLFIICGVLPVYGMRMVPQVSPDPCNKDVFVIHVPDEASVTERKQEYSRGLKDIVINIFGTQDMKKSREAERAKKEKQKKLEQEADKKSRVLRDMLGLNDRYVSDIKNELLRKQAETIDQTVKDEHREQIVKRERRSKVDPQDLVVTIEALKHRGREDRREKEDLVKAMEAQEKGDMCKNATLGCSLVTVGIMVPTFLLTLSFQMYNYFDGSSAACKTSY